MLKQIVLIIILLKVGISIAKQETVVVIYSHNTNGLLENCNCPERAYGALEKRAAVIDSIRKIYKNILLVDTGDILDIRDNPLLHDYIIQAYDHMKYDYWVPGDQDFVEGTDFFLQRMRNMSGQMLVSNLKYKGKSIGESYAIREFGKIKIGLTGTTRDDLIKYLNPAEKEVFSFEDQMSILKKIVDDLFKKTDFVILLSHSGYDRDRQIAEEIPKLGLIIGGHSQTLLTNPERIGPTQITQIGESGYRLGILALNFEQKTLKSIDNSIILLKQQMADDPGIMKLINEYHDNRLKKLKSIKKINSIK
jgi:5'-nucleotidase